MQLCLGWRSLQKRCQINWQKTAIHAGPLLEPRNRVNRLTSEFVTQVSGRYKRKTSQRGEFTGAEDQVCWICKTARDSKKGHLEIWYQFKWCSRDNVSDVMPSRDQICTIGWQEVRVAASLHKYGEDALVFRGFYLNLKQLVQQQRSDGSQPPTLLPNAAPPEQLLIPPLTTVAAVAARFTPATHQQSPEERFLSFIYLHGWRDTCYLKLDISTSRPDLFPRPATQKS